MKKFVLVKIVIALLGAIAAACVIFSAVSIVRYGVVNIPFGVSESEIVKTAVNEGDLSGKKYIICEREATTGFSWRLIRDENGQPSRKCCIITGEDPYEELNVNGNFWFADNRFVFYVVDQKWHEDESIGDHTEYIVSGWDILYPVDHGLVPFNPIPRHIMKWDQK